MNVRRSTTGIAACGAAILITGLIFVAGLLLAPAALAAQSASSGFYIRGGGFGHDIGMSQYGAAGYAQHGWNSTSILEHYYSHTTVRKLSSTSYVTVLLAQGSASFTGATSVTGTGVKLNSRTTYSVRIDGRRMELTAGGRVLTSHGKALTFAVPLTVTAAKMVKFIGHGWYRGSLQFRFGASGNACTNGGAIATVNRVGLNDYVRGVVTDEMPSSWPQQALDAQAVASRTYAITAGSADPGHWMLYGTTCSEMYGGVSAESAGSNRAVNQTYNQVVEYNGKPVFTPYFSSSGGETKSITFSWGVTGDPWLVGVSDPYDDAFNNPYHSWGFNVSIARVQGQLASAGYLKGSLRDINATANNVQIVGSRGTTTVDGLAMEELFGTLSPNMTDTTMWDHAGVVGTSKLGIWGTILPADHARVTAQLHDGSGWKSVSATVTGGGGAFHMALKQAGAYRIVYHNIDGPTVDVGS